MVFREAGEDVIDGHDVEVFDGPQALHRPEKPDERHSNFLVRVVDQVRDALQNSGVVDFFFLLLIFFLSRGGGNEERDKINEHILYLYMKYTYKYQHDRSMKSSN